MRKNQIWLYILRLIRHVRTESMPLDELRSLNKSAISILQENATLDAAGYIEKNLEKALVFEDKLEFLAFAISQIDPDRDGIIAEFGVFKGQTLNFIARKNPGNEVYGFDSFQGLQEKWFGTSLNAGFFSLGGSLPIVEKNVALHKGWFSESIPTFLRTNSLVANFLHIDCDTFESSSCVLNLFANRIKPGTVLVFDEYFGYPNWKNGEYLAWQEFTKKFSIKYSYIAFSNEQAAVRVL
jgi:hypothetical protein